jgi:Ni,Fe-hydrogenase I small subunit
MVLYAANASWKGVIAWVDTNAAPVKIPGGKPVMDVPKVPISPVMTVGPVLVMVAKPKAPKLSALPRETETAY